MLSSVVDRNLLYGVLALQLDFINREQLVHAMHTWVSRKRESLGSILQEQQSLTSVKRELLGKLVEKHLEQNGFDLRKSLAALSTVQSICEQLNRIRDPDLQATLANLKSSGQTDVYQTVQEFTAITPIQAQTERFRIIRPHARGGLGEVYVALDTELHRDVALKEIHAHYADDPISRSRFLLEAEVTGGLEHPGIVPVYGLGTYPDGRPYYAMRFIQGDSLREAIHRFHGLDNTGIASGKEKLAPASNQQKRSPFRSVEFRKLLGCLIDVCNAVHYAHCRGVLHRDLKPANIMLGRHGETIVVDWGLAKISARDDLPDEIHEPTLRPPSELASAETVTGVALGTPEFMSPEQAQGRLDQLGPASDVYSLGATLYQLLTAQPPVSDADLGEKLRKVKAGDIRPPQSLNPLIPRALDAICRKAMATQPVDRYRTVRALADDIEHWLADEPVVACQENVIERSARWARRHKTRVAVLIVAGMLTTVALALVTTVVGVKNRQLDVSNQQLRSSNIQLDEARKNAVAAAQSESLQRRKSDLAAAHVLFEQAYTRYRDRDVSYGLLLMVRALQQLESLGKAEEFSETAEGQELDREIRQFALGVRNHLGGASTQLLPLLHMANIQQDSRGQGIRFTPDETKISALDYYGNEKTWDVLAGMKVKERPISPGQALGWACDAGLAKVIVGCSDHRVRIYDLSLQPQLPKSLMHQSPVRYVAVSADGAKAVTGSNDGEVKVWDVATGQQVGNALQHKALTCIGISGIGSRIVTGDGNIARMWDVPTATQIGADLVHPQTVNSVVISGDGSRVTTVTSEGAVRTWEVATSKQITKGFNHESICCIAMNAAGTKIVTGGRDGTARIWNAQTNTQLGENLIHQGIECVACSVDGTKIATAGRDGTAQVWSVATGKPIGNGFAHPLPIDFVAFSAEGSQILTSCGDDKIRTWNIASEECTLEKMVHPSWKCFALSKNGAKVITGSRDNSVRVWDTATGTQSGSTLLLPVEVTCVELSPDGTKAITATKDNVARTWNLVTGKEISASDVHPSPILSVAFNRLGNRFVTGCQDGKARIWDVVSARQMGENIAHQAEIQSVAFDSDGAKVVTGGSDGTARIWDLETGRQLAENMVHQGSIHGVAFNADGTTIITAGADGLTRIWDAKILQQNSASMAIPFSGWGCILSPDGNVFVMGLRSTMADVFDVATGNQLRRFSHPDLIREIALSTDGRKVATVGSDNKTRVWDVATGKQITEVSVRPVCIAISPDGSRLATSDAKPRIWDTSTGKQIDAELARAEFTTSMAFSGDGKKIITGSPNRVAQLWDVTTGKQIGENIPHQEGIQCVAFSPDGTQVATGSNVFRVWEVATGKQIFESPEHENVGVVRFSLDGSEIVTAAADTTRIWDVTTFKQIGEIFRQPDRVNSVAVGTNGSTVVTAGFLELSQWELVTLEGSPESLRIWIEASAAAFVDDTAQQRPLSIDAWQARKSNLQKLGGPPKTWLDYRQRQLSLLMKE